MGKDSDMFSDEDEVDNIFDTEEEVEEEEVDEADEEFGVEPETTEELDLAALGIVAERFKGFKIKYPKKKIFISGKLTKNAFKWYLANCTMKELEIIIEPNLPEGFDELLAKTFSKEIAKNLKEEEEEEEESNDLSEKEKKTISGYIDQAAKLRKNIETQKETINTILERSEKYFQYTAFLYDFMSNKMVIKPKKKPTKQVETVVITAEEIAQIDEIDEVVSQ